MNAGRGPWGRVGSLNRRFSYETVSPSVEAKNIA
jgi:hypothetical protein